MQQSDPGFWNALWEVLVPSNTGEFWTMIAGLGTVAVAMLAWQGLRSLGLAKSDILNRATRDARACAVERCEEFANDIIPGNRPVLQAIAKSEVAAFVKDTSDVQFDPDDAGQVEAAKEFMRQVPNNVRRQAIMFLNRLEAWATYFTNGLAEHENSVRSMRSGLLHLCRAALPDSAGNSINYNSGEISESCKAFQKLG